MPDFPRPEELRRPGVFESSRRMSISKSVRKIIGRGRSLTVPPVCRARASAQYAGTPGSPTAIEVWLLGTTFFCNTSCE